MKILKRIKRWFFGRFLPMWAKETLLVENQRLQKDVEALRNELEQKEAYINGLTVGVKSLRKVVINTTEGKK